MPKRKKYNKSRRDLFCYGCAFSKDDIGFPGKPGLDQLGVFSPCHLCMRNPAVQFLIDGGDPLHYDCWPDGSAPVALPMDCYMSADMLDQTEFWQEQAVEHATQSQLRNDVQAIAKEYGIDMGGHEVALPPSE